MITKMYLEKSRGRYRSRYLILQHSSFTRLCSITLFIQINFLFNQIIVETDKHTKLIE